MLGNYSHIILRSLFCFLLLSVAEPCYAYENPCQNIGLAKSNEDKCISLKKKYAFKDGMIRACKEFSKLDEEKIDCIRSGASEEGIKFCVGLKFRTADVALSCLHYVGDIDVARSCAKLSSNEENVLHCMKVGRDVGWIRECSVYKSEDEKMDCIQSGQKPGRGLASTPR